MRTIRGILLLGALGALVSGLLTFAIFAVVGLLDKGNVQEVLFYGIFFGIGSAFIGAVVGALVAMLRATWLGGLAIGLVAILLYVVIYALSSGPLAEFTRNIQGSTFFLVFYGAPMILTGVITALIRARRERRQLPAAVDAPAA